MGEQHQAPASTTLRNKNKAHAYLEVLASSASPVTKVELAKYDLKGGSTAPSAGAFPRTGNASPYACMSVDNLKLSAATKGDPGASTNGAPSANHTPPCSLAAVTGATSANESTSAYCVHANDASATNTAAASGAGVYYALASNAGAATATNAAAATAT